MKNDTVLSDPPTKEASLPGDFARRVLLIAQGKRDRGRRRRRAAATAALILLIAAIPLATVRYRLERLASRNSVGAKPELQGLSSDDALAYELVETARQRYPEDYLLPNAIALTGLSSGYSEASWQYDPQWTHNR